jgi:hypothetical protein
VIPLFFALLYFLALEMDTYVTFILLYNIWLSFPTLCSKTVGGWECGIWLELLGSLLLGLAWEGDEEKDDV